MRRLFFSDVHLTPADPARSRRLVRFLQREAPGTGEIYILGDLFDYWIGPAHLHLPDYRDALDALRRAVRAGTRIVFLCGNRDFYMRGFTEATGIEVVPRRTHAQMTIDSRRVTLCHGDYLEGRRDLAFLVQRLIRSWVIEWIWTRLPAPLAVAGARFYRRVSRWNKRRGAADRSHLAPYGLDPEQVAETFAAGADVVVCGHVHRAQEVRDPVPGQHGVLYTLGDWTGGESYLEVEDGRWRLCPYQDET
ncbi:MAG: UDP-2,3-diacylglucosamine diphosphatase [Planctomycetota bacterium]|nr:UDP-2,3-diacylglucosamine diphosphatase [Planctomycetota bacterium]